MGKKKMCPVSGKACIDCTLYIGRHYYNCLSKDDESRAIVEGMREKKRKYVQEHDDGHFGITEFDNAPKTGSWYHNIEDIYLHGQG